ncbi:hypothetical protein [Pelomonas cellulosilytica]|uniref:Transposase n=1 Tax=Pelomonas cellulosilytica TaxID=2906762 RepID=A0ABS8Y196_9BURK|nr:hypothetical protein [Pelomonas sp. P8]MCE4557992.1 hypothetical protein [Pelomonas sp. P8]
MSRSKTDKPSALVATRPDPFRAAFQQTVELLIQRRADLLSETAINAYVDCDWLTWRGGSLKLTTTGENICAQLRNKARLHARA